MAFSKKCNYYTVTALFLLIFSCESAQSQQMDLLAARLQVDSIHVDTTNRTLLNAAQVLQQPVQTYVKKEFAKLPEGMIQDQFNCLQNGLPLNYNKYSKTIINAFLTRDRKFIAKMLQHKNIYFPIYEDMLQKYGLPDELKYLSIVESGLNPKAVSRARAVGLWQFMSATGRQYKLHQDTYIDERMDPYKATEAACRYLKDLHGMFNDWELALAAYNCGPGNVRRAIRRSGNKKTFWQIYSFLPRETRMYVPKFIAMNYLMQHAEDYDITAAESVNLIAADTIVVNQYVNLAVLASQINVPLEDLRNLNPHIKKNIIPSYLKNYCLRIPSEKKELFVLNRISILQLAGIRKSSSTYASAASRQDNLLANKRKVIHRIKPGDVLGKIAETYQVRITDIQRWNQIKSTVIQPGKSLVIWVNKEAQNSDMLAGNRNIVVPAISQPEIKKSALIAPIRVYFVQPGDTLSKISEIYGGVSVEKIKKNNKLKSNDLKPGQKIIIG